MLIKDDVPNLCFLSNVFETFAMTFFCQSKIYQSIREPVEKIHSKICWTNLLAFALENDMTDIMR